VVLILGRFTPARKATLDQVREVLRGHNFVPMLFDFDKPASRNTIETVMLLARMARFVVADLTDARSVLQELQALVPSSPSIPVQPLIASEETWPGMWDSLTDYRTVLPPFEYSSRAALTAALPSLIDAADRAAARLIKHRAEGHLPSLH
jgi:hypothetical protein